MAGIPGSKCPGLALFWYAIWYTISMAQETTHATTGAVEMYTVQSGDDLATISQQFYGDESGAPKILEANRDQLATADQLRAGMVLMIPT